MKVLAIIAFMKIFMLGDSLMVGSAPYVEEQFPQWDYVEVDRVGMSLAEGLTKLRKEKVLADARGGYIGDAIYVSLGTNDSWERFDYFVECIDEVRRIIGRHPVIVWATIWRPGDGKKNAYVRWNSYLRKRATKYPRKFKVADWALLVRDYPRLLAPDGIHATALGYKRRAELYHQALLD